MDVAVEKRRQRRMKRVEEKVLEIEAKAAPFCRGSDLMTWGALSLLNIPLRKKKSRISSLKLTATNI
ncbi:Uncharacterised protein [Klebsiella pneumoniae]|uniref:Uncharacterized protein n=1 Tax=Klebsiella pneumoniae TaxID=573 RepID=A0A2X3IMJ7_KLEPN|nr:Uncharacterised protein [Klebsiella pneumoniae]